MLRASTTKMVQALPGGHHPAGCSDTLRGPLPSLRISTASTATGSGSGALTGRDGTAPTSPCHDGMGGHGAVKVGGDKSTDTLSRAQIAEVPAWHGPCDGFRS